VSADGRAEIRLLARYSLIEIAVCSRSLLQIEFLENDTSKRLIPNEFSDVSIEVAVSSQAALKPIQSQLPLPNRSIRTEAMLEEEKSSTRLEHPVHLAQRFANIIDAAQSERADHAIEHLIIERELFAAEEALLYFDAALADALPGSALHPAIWVDGRNLMDVLRIGGKVQARSEPNLQNMALDCCQQLPAMLRHKWSVESEVAQSRKN
jgi:hypothetical protein